MKVERLCRGLNFYPALEMCSVYGASFTYSYSRLEGRFAASAIYNTYGVMLVKKHPNLWRLIGYGQQESYRSLLEVDY